MWRDMPNHGKFEMHTKLKVKTMSLHLKMVSSKKELSMSRDGLSNGDGRTRVCYAQNKITVCFFVEQQKMHSYLCT